MSAMGRKRNVRLGSKADDGFVNDVGGRFEMKLSVPQWLWLLAVAALFGIVMVDIIGLVQVPPIYWMLGFGLLVPIGWWVMPSMKELNKAQRRHSTQRRRS